MGDPAPVRQSVFGLRQWVSADVTLQQDAIRIGVDGRPRWTYFPTDSLRAWDPGQIALGDAVYVGGPWQGQIRLAEVSTPGYAAAYIRLGALLIPVSYLHLPDHIGPSLLWAWSNGLPFCSACCRSPRSASSSSWSEGRPWARWWLTLLGAALVAVLAVGKFSSMLGTPHRPSSSWRQLECC